MKPKKTTIEQLEKEKQSTTPERRKEIQSYLDWFYYGIKL